MRVPRVVAIVMVSAAAALATSAAQAQRGSSSGASRISAPSPPSGGGHVGQAGSSIGGPELLLDGSGAPTLPYRANDRLRNAGPASENPGPGGFARKTGAAKSKNSHPDFVWLPTSNPTGEGQSGAKPRAGQGGYPSQLRVRRNAEKAAGAKAAPKQFGEWTADVEKPSTGQYYVTGVRHRYSTGGGNSQNTGTDSRAGTGVLKSTDGGRSWSKRGGFKSVGGLALEHEVMD